MIVRIYCPNQDQHWCDGEPALVHPPRAWWRSWPLNELSAQHFILLRVTIVPKLLLMFLSSITAVCTTNHSTVCCNGTPELVYRCESQRGTHGRDTTTVCHDLAQLKQSYIILLFKYKIFLKTFKSLSTQSNLYSQRKHKILYKSVDIESNVVLFHFHFSKITTQSF